jgi:hypothetical protein
MLKSIVCTYPDFRELPKGLKQMLLASENLFFSDARTTPRKNSAAAKRPLWQPLHARFFSNRRETPAAPARAFRWDYWSK